MNMHVRNVKTYACRKATKSSRQLRAAAPSAGSIDRTVYRISKDDFEVNATDVADLIYPDSNTTVTEAIGFRADLIGETGDNKRVDTRQTFRLTLGEMKTVTFVEKTDRLSISSSITDFVNLDLKIDVIGVDARARGRPGGRRG